ncbi:MAG: DUF6273 domain-containing protein [Acholeplasmatales bacterium]|nr:DUF6273 domain-containing protein [Acholeplasmatales bacterium]
MKKIIGFASIVLASLALLFVITSCANSTNNNDNSGNQESSNVTSTNPNEPSQTEPSNPEESVNPGTDDNVYYTITFKNDDDTILYSADYKEGTMPSYDGTPTKDKTAEFTYTFNGWNPSIEAVSRDMVYTATYTSTLNSYKITLKLNDDKAGTVTNSNTTYNYGENVTIEAIANQGYTFDGWYDGDNEISTEPSYSFNMPGNDIVYTAKFSANTNTKYKVEHYLQNLDDDNYPEVPNDIDNLTGTTNTLTAAEVKTYEGFTSPEITQININGDESTVIKLYYTRNSYTVTLVKKPGGVYNHGVVLGDGTYKYGEEITIEAIANLGYVFTGWYKDNKVYNRDAKFQYKIGSSNETFEGRFLRQPNIVVPNDKYTITIDNQVEGVTISGVTSGNEYVYGTTLVLTATNIPENMRIAWERSDGEIYVGDRYIFQVPSTNITITIKDFKNINKPTYTKEDNKIYFGTYPQTKVTDNALIDKLNQLAGDLPTSDNKYNWTDYNYYISSNVTSFMYYQDIDYNNDGAYDYRGVYFTQYRPYDVEKMASSYGNPSTYTYQNENEYVINEVYWFSFDPIEWNILKEDNGKALIIANLILDSQDYYPSSSPSSFNHNGGNGFANNYELSNIRKFLNDNFYNIAFNDLQKEIIELTEVDNSSVCNNTNDKLFLLSLQEKSIYCDPYELSIAKGTDYSKCQGLYVSNATSSMDNGNWWLRTGLSNQGLQVASSAWKVYFDGSSNGDNVQLTSIGVRPACWITL